MFGVFEIALGWAWHTAYRARKFWKLRREGALIAAAAVAIVGVADVARHGLPEPAPVALAAVAARPSTPARPAVTAMATPVAETPQAVETIAAIPMPPERIRTIAAVASPSAPKAEASGKLFTDPISTGSIKPVEEAHPKKKPARQDKPTTPE
jgi:hypothetical protein